MLQVTNFTKEKWSRSKDLEIPVDLAVKSEKSGINEARYSKIKKNLIIYIIF